MSDSPPTKEGFEGALNRAADAIAAERPERQRANRILVVGIVIALILLVLLLVQGKLDRDERERRTKDATAQRAQQLKLAKRNVVTGDQIRRTLFLLDCAVVTSERYPNPNRDPVITEAATAYLNECFRLNGVHPDTAIKLPEDKGL